MRILKQKNYLMSIRNSVESQIFRNLFVIDDTGNERDILENGSLSCAFFVSSILSIFRLIDGPHTTVDTTILKMVEYGWKEVTFELISPGDVLVWEAKESNEQGDIRSSHRHIGFSIGNNEAVSNSSKYRHPVIHSMDYEGTRKIEHIFHWDL